MAVQAFSARRAGRELLAGMYSQIAADAAELSQFGNNVI